MTAGPPDPLAVALEAAAEAGALLAAGLGARHTVDIKRGTTDLVTECDRGAEAIIVARLRRAFPRDQVLAEEGGLSAGAASRRWLVDPLDGTTNFAHGLPLYCISIALEVDGRVEVGVVATPSLGWTFAARRGGGATLTARAPGGGETTEVLRVSEATELSRALLTTGFPYDRQTSADNNFVQFVAFQRRAQGVRRLGAAALDLALVARGVLDGYWEMKLKPWDVAAGALLVEEAGGKVSGWRGEPLVVDRGAVVAAPAALHGQMIAVLAEVGVPESAR